MRRSLKRLIPVFALALLVQLLSPIGAIRFVAATALDPLAGGQLCSAMAAEQDDSTSGLPHGGCCAICAVGLGGAAPPAASAPLQAAVARSYQSLSWPHREPAPSLRRLSAHAQPRAPPSAG
ncbi:DUF2946 family protein [Rhodopseudomonas palustris]|nr:DUF2946 family protein [Rhodopseudomonas palustris]